jgi:type IV pilus assembly protein PilX
MKPTGLVRRTSPRLAARKNESGTALIVAMLFLVILAMLGISAMSGTTLEEKMSGNARDRNLAMQAAEAALRDGERDLNNAGGRVTSTAVFTAACSNALCLTTCTATTPMTCPNATLANLDNPVNSAFFGQYQTSSEVPIQGPSQQPTYMIELLTGNAALNPASPTPPSGSTNRLFRITSKAWGQNSNTVVILQEIYLMPL